jgi:zinc transporter ZupT
LATLPSISRRLVAFSGALLVAVAGFWLPEVAALVGWTAAVAWLCAGVALLWVIDRYVSPVCPACSRTHDHEGCSTRLHGFASPLIVTAALHSLLDGWGLAAQRADAGPAAVALGIAIAAHKIPEGLALGVILRSALRSRAAAFGWATIVQSVTITGGVLGSLASSWLSRSGIGILVGLTGGGFLFLGLHALHGEWRRMRGDLARQPG